MSTINSTEKLHNRPVSGRREGRLVCPTVPPSTLHVAFALSHCFLCLVKQLCPCSQQKLYPPHACVCVCVFQHKATLTSSQHFPLKESPSPT